MSPSLFHNTTNKLHKSIEGVFDGVKYDDPSYEMVKGFKKNVVQFAGVKSANFTRQVKGAAKEIQVELMKQFERQLDVENNLTSLTVRSAKTWLEFERTKDIYPNLEYMPSRSVNKRSSHKAYYGIVKPIDDPFWASFMPPNGYECKCSVRKTDSAVTGNIKEVIKVSPGVVGNAAKEKIIFSNNHSMVKNLTDKGRKQIKEQLEHLKLDIPYNDFADYISPTKSKVSVHLFADDFDVDENFKAAVTLANALDKIDIKITPHIVIKDRKNPEYLINNKIADLKHQSGKQVSSNLSSAIKQGCEIVVIKIMKECPHDTNRILNQIKGNLKTRENSTIKEIILIDIEGNVKKYKT